MIWKLEILLISHSLHKENNTCRSDEKYLNFMQTENLKLFLYDVLSLVHTSKLNM